MNTKVIGALVGVLLVAAGAVSVSAQEPAEQEPQMMQRMMRQMMQARNQQMMQQRDALLEDLHSSTERLDELVVTMNASRGDAKTDAIAAAVSELAAERKSLVALIEAEPGMMQQMQMMQMMEMMQMMMGQMTGGAGTNGAEGDQP